MKCNQIDFKFEEDEEEYSFDENLCFTNNKKLVKTLSLENIKNTESSLIIKSMNNLPIYDVIQIKINILDTCTIFANFDKENFDEETRKKLISEIKLLKDNVDPTIETQKNKISNVIKALNKVKPIFATYRQHGDINITFDDLKPLEQSNFILIVLLNESKQKTIEEKIPQDITKNLIIKHIKNVRYTGSVATPKIKIKYGSKKLQNGKDFIVHTNDYAPGEATAVIEFSEEYKKTPQIELEYKIVGDISKPRKVNKTKKEQGKALDFKLYTTDYLFITIFDLLFSFGLYTAVFELLINESMATVLFILSAVFLGVLYFSFYGTVFKRKVERHKNLKYWLITYNIVGAVLGIAIGYVTTKYAMKIPEDAEINLKLLFEIIIPSSLVLSLISPFVSLLINKIIDKTQKNKK